MEHQSREATMGEVCDYLSSNLKQEIFNLLYSTYENEEYLTKDLGCSAALLRKWENGQEYVSDHKYMPIILSLALDKCPEVKNLLEVGLIKTVQCLCSELKICGKAQDDEVQFKDNLRLFMNTLDNKSRKIFWHFQWHRHVKLSELVNLINASADMEVLYILREVINPTAERIFGRPLLEFSTSKIDSITGENVLFNWWLLDFEGDNQSITGDGKEPLMDLFDEDDQIVIVSEVSPSIRVRDWAKVEQRHGILSINIDKLT